MAQNSPLNLHENSLIHRSGPFAFDSEAQSLTRHGVKVALSAKPLAILALLTASSGKLVTRSDLKQQLWPGCERIDTERRLNTAMRALREALADAADTPRFIETIRGRGYRWVGGPAHAKQPPPRRPMAVAASLMCALVFGASFSPPSISPPTPAQSDRFIAIAARAEHAPADASRELDALVLERPDFAAAQTLRARLAMRGWRAAPSQSRLNHARAALAEAHFATGDSPDLAPIRAELALLADRDWRGAERIYLTSLAHQPSNFEARRGLAWLLLNSGRRGAALSQVQTLLAASELDDSKRADLGWLLLRMRRNDLAMSLCDVREARELNLLSCRHTALARAGHIAAAREVALELMSRLAASPADIARVRGIGARAGYRRFLAWRADHFPLGEGQWFQRAQLEAEAGNLRTALRHLERASAANDPSLFKLATTPEFDPLRAWPPFQALERSVGAQTFD